jgi:NitT/TauT family transport system ATP-binding protein
MWDFRSNIPGSIPPGAAPSSTTRCAAPGFPTSAALTQNNCPAACASASASPALAVRPAILLMDEPLSALDSQTRELLMEDFVRLLTDGAMGAVYVTHNLEEAVRLADRIVVLSRRPGRIREVVPIAMTRAERGEIGAREKLLALQNELWALIREQAIDAEREVQDA